jgi:CBS domain containing-hemolysin-like protein
VIEIAVVVFLLIISGAFSGTEVAFTSLSVDQLERLRRTRGRSGQLVGTLHDRLDVVLTSITIGNNLANLAASALVSALTIRMFGESWLPATTVGLTLLVLVFGEVTPKQIGIVHNEFVTLHMARFLRAFSVVFAPAIWMIRTVGNALTRLTGGRRRGGITLDGLKHLVRYAGRNGVLGKLDAAIVRNVIRSKGAEVEALMTHRTRLFSLDARTTVGDAFGPILKSGFSRVPVYDGDHENIVGIALLKDVALAVEERKTSEKLADLAMQPLFVPETRTFDEVLVDLRREQMNMAVVLDEYGGVAGVVTMEDLVEEFVGEIYDERETEERERIERVSECVYRLMGDTLLHVLNDQLDVGFPVEGDANTIAGYLTEQIGHIPRRGENLETAHGVLEIEKVNRRRIVSVLYHRTPGDSE